MKKRVKVGKDYIIVPMDNPVSAGKYILQKTGAAFLGWNYARQIAKHFGISDTKSFWKRQKGCVVYTYCRPYHVEIL